MPLPQYLLADFFAMLRHRELQNDYVATQAAVCRRVVLYLQQCDLELALCEQRVRMRAAKSPVQAAGH